MASIESDSDNPVEAGQGGSHMLNRSTLDVAIPMIFGIVIAALAVTTTGDAVAIFAVIGGGIVALYYAAFRQNLPE